MHKFEIVVGSKRLQVSADTSGIVSIGDREYSIEFSGNGLGLCTLDDGRIRERIFVKKIADSAYRIWMNHRSFEVEIEDPLTRLAAGLQGGGTKTEGERRITAPMPGLISRIEVVVGDRISRGQGLIVLEAMKMENEIRSPIDGTVRSISAAKGTSVEKGQLLMTIGPTEG